MMELSESKKNLLKNLTEKNRGCHGCMFLTSECNECGKLEYNGPAYLSGCSILEKNLDDITADECPLPLTLEDFQEFVKESI